MSGCYADEVLERIDKYSKIYEVLGLEKEEYGERAKKSLKELSDILRDGSYTRAGLKLLDWLGIDKREVTPDVLIKAIMIVKYAVSVTNRLQLLKWRGKVEKG